jgi:hypothetical protein
LQLEKRKEKRELAEEEIKKAQESGDQEALARFSKVPIYLFPNITYTNCSQRTVRVTQKHNEDAKKLLKLMGVPIVEAPCEAEAQCAAMAKAGLVRYFWNSIKPLFMIARCYWVLKLILPGVRHRFGRYGLSYTWNTNSTSTFDIF